MKKTFIALATLFAILGFAHSAFAACTPISPAFPTSLDTFTTGTCIPSASFNAYEAKMGVNDSTVSSSLDFQINSLFTSWGSEIFASSSVAFPWINFGTVGLPSSTWAKTANNLSDLNNSSTARTNLGLGTMATQSVPSSGIVTSNGTTISSTATPLSAANGGTATTTALGSNAFTSTAIPTSYVSTFNGNSSAVTYNVAAGTGISVSTSTSLGTITNTGVTSFNGATGTVTANIPAIATTTKSIFDAAPATSTPDIMFYTETGFTIKQFDCVNSPVAGNSVYVNIGVSSTVNISTGTLMTAPFLCNSTSTIQSTTTFANAIVPANSIIQMFFSGTPSTTGIYGDFKF